VVIDAAAEPSVGAGLDGNPTYLIQSNLLGTANCLEFARNRSAAFVFLSTSRVYPIAALRSLMLQDLPTRFALVGGHSQLGASRWGISEAYTTTGSRSLYGATKLASELLVQEYAAAYGLASVINRCGVIAGPGQFGYRGQGVFSYWIAGHLFEFPLCYTGYGGTGKQVRDLLHPYDLFELIDRQLGMIRRLSADIYNVGGGRDNAVSLCEMTNLCRKVTGRNVPIASEPTGMSVDIPYYVSDIRKATTEFDWWPKRGLDDIVRETAAWMKEHEGDLRPILTP
jgi:CDP-paratose 2-epimerase